MMLPIMVIAGLVGGPLNGQCRPVPTHGALLGHETSADVQKLKRTVTGETNKTCCLALAS